MLCVHAVLLYSPTPVALLSPTLDCGMPANCWRHNSAPLFTTASVWHGALCTWCYSGLARDVHLQMPGVMCALCFDSAVPVINQWCLGHCSKAGSQRRQRATCVLGCIVLPARCAALCSCVLCCRFLHCAYGDRLGYMQYSTG
jgi:hypothetical protein